MLDLQQIRSFIAISISSELRDEIERLLAVLKSIPGNIKWVNSDSVHLTLKFLGNISILQVEQINSILKESVNGITTFQLKTSGKGAFPSVKNPRVYWIGIEETENNNLILIQKKIEEELIRIGFESEKRKFSPHLTIGRVRDFKNIQQVNNVFINHDFPTIEFSVQNIFLMKSQLTPRGAIYSVQNSVKLL
jgi:2'-5' RNA ligase